MKTTENQSAINRLLAQQRTQIHDSWNDEIQKTSSMRFQTVAEKVDVRQHTALLLDQVTTVFASYPATGTWQFSESHPLAMMMSDFSARRAASGFTPTETAEYVMSLKNVLTLALVREASCTSTALEADLSAVIDVIGRLTLTTFSAFVATRERIIAGQSASLIDLSSPVIRLWDRVLLLPLVGVIDTTRARRFTENLLEAIARYEASVSVIDVTGVPVFETSVVRHLMKTVEAAQLLGTRVILTGLSPEAAQTITKLGIVMTNVITRTTLRTGVAEALALIGRRIVAIAPSQS